MGRKKDRPPASKAHPPAAPHAPVFSITYNEPPLSLLNEWRGILDRALTAGQGVLDKDSTSPSWRSYVERDMAIVREARAGEIVAAMLAPEVTTACMNIERFATASNIEEGAVRLATPRIAEGAVKQANRDRAKQAAEARTSITTDEIANVKAFCAEKGWNPNTLTAKNKRTIAEALDKTPRRIGDYLKIISEASS